MTTSRPHTTSISKWPGTSRRTPAKASANSASPPTSATSFIATDEQALRNLYEETSGILDEPEDDRLIVANPHDTPNKEPRILCSLGLKT